MACVTSKPRFTSMRRSSSWFAMGCEAMSWRMVVWRSCFMILQGAFMYKYTLIWINIQSGFVKQPGLSVLS